MSEGSLMWGEQEEYVMVTADYTYQYQKCTYSMHEGEILMLLKRTNNDWWQVIRGGERHAFYAPTQHIQVTAVSTEKMKNILKEERQKLKLNSNSGNDNIALARRSQGHSSEFADGRETFPQPEPQPSNNTAASQSYATKKEASRVMVEGKDVHPSRQQQFCSLRNYSLKGAPQRSGTGDMPPSGACQQESSSSTHTSKSSLNDSSVESLRYSHLRKQGMKAGSHDELTSGGRIRSHSTLEVSKHKAASSEELDGRCSGRDLSFRSNQLSPRHRSSSFDFRIFHKELSFSEMKQGSLDKSRKLRISKDLGNRRRSWAVEEIRACENFRPSLTRGEAVDAAIVLDVPPKLPPKQRKHKFETFNSSSESTGKLEDPIDIRLEEILSKSGQLSGGNQLCLNKESDKKHFRHSSDPLLLSENEKKSSITQQEVQESKDPPVALPRKLLLPQASQECLKEDKAGTVSSFSDSMLRDTNGNQIKKSSSHHFIGSNNSAPSTSDGEVFRSGSLVLHGGQKQRGKTHEPTGKESSAPEKTEKKETTPTLPRKAHSTQECPPQSRSPLSKVPGLTFRSFKQKGSRRPFEGKGEEKGRETRETPTLDSSHTGKMMPTPPSPQTSPQRIVFDDWGEYIDDASRRPYYYNSRTREKRWKPPRKGIHSVSIPEIPPSAKMEDSMRGSSIRSPPKSPTPDYPISPRLVHKPFSYTTPPSSSLTKTATQTTSSTTLPHPPAAMSQTLPASSMLSSKAISPSHLSKQKVVPLPLAAPPAVPPSSAKPSYPTTPTTPEFSDVTDDQKNYALLDILYKMPLPKGWEKKYDAFTQRIYFFNTVTRQRWLATINDEGKVYYYEESGTKSQWRLPQVEDSEDIWDKSDSLSRPLSSPENFRLSCITENLQELSEYTLREGFLHRTFFMREGKKVRKNWTASYARYIVRTFNSGSTGLLYFSKTKDEDKKAEIFEFFPPCYLENALEKKTSRQQVLGLRNAQETEVLLQFDEKEIAQEWFKLLSSHDGVEYSIAPVVEKEEKKGKRGSEKIKRIASMEQLNPDSKGITDKLRSFIKRRPMKETLEKKGIYKESVFGSTLSELCSQDKTLTPIFVLQCIKYIESSEENLCADGLYRISGNAAQIQKIRFEVAQRNYGVLSQEKEIHNLSGALKLFFRELKEPLIPFDNYQDFIQATGSEFRRVNQQAEKLMKAVNKLPPENYDTLKLLMQHLLRVSDFESENRMSLSNLAIVFGPCIMWPKVTVSHALMTDIMLHNRVVEGLLTDFSKIFSVKR